MFLQENSFYEKSKAEMSDFQTFILSAPTMSKDAKFLTSELQTWRKLNCRNFRGKVSDF